MLVGGSSVSLHAATGTGKTWLADQIVLAIRNEGRSVCRLDLGVVESGWSVFQQLEKAISAGEVDSDHIHDAWRGLRSKLEALTEPVVVVLDEFDSVVRYGDALDFLKLLREIVHRPWKTNVTCLILSRRPLETVEAEVRGISTIATLCVPEYLGPIVDEDLAQDWDAATGVEVGHLRECLQWSAGYPPLVRYWLVARPDLSPSAAAEHQQILEFERLMDHLDLLGLRDAAAQLVLGPVVDDWFREKRHLQMLGVVGDDSGRPSFGHHEVFRACLRMRTWSLDPWGSLGLVEVRLRSLIESVMSDAFGHDWATSDAAKKYRPVGRCYAAAEKHVQTDRKRFGRAGSWLAYTYPQDLGEIVLSAWEHFSVVFASSDKRYWSERFNALASYRTPVAHNRAEVLGPAERVQCRLFAEEVIRAVDVHMNR